MKPLKRGAFELVFSRRQISLNIMFVQRFDNLLKELLGPRQYGASDSGFRSTFGDVRCDPIGLFSEIVKPVKAHYR